MLQNNILPTPTSNKNPQSSRFLDMCPPWEMLFTLEGARAVAEGKGALELRLLKVVRLLNLQCSGLHAVGPQRPRIWCCRFGIAEWFGVYGSWFTV